MKNTIKIFLTTVAMLLIFGFQIKKNQYNPFEIYGSEVVESYSGLYLHENDKYKKIDSLTCYNFNSEGLCAVFEIQQNWDKYDRVRIIVEVYHKLDRNQKPERDKDSNTPFHATFTKMELTEGKFKDRKYVIIDKEEGANYENKRILKYKTKVDEQYAYFQLTAYCENISGYREDWVNGSVVKKPIYDVIDTQVFNKIPIGTRKHMESLTVECTKKEKDKVINDLKLKGYNTVNWFSNKKEVFAYDLPDDKNCSFDKFSLEISSEQIKSAKRK